MNDFFTGNSPCWDVLLMCNMCAIQGINIQKNNKINQTTPKVPTCSAKHLPGFLTYSSAFKEKKVDEIVCLSVNDPFVMKAWCDANKAGNDILFLADGNASLSKAMGLTFDGSMYSLGVRSQRFAMILTGLKVEKLFIEKPGVFDVSSAQKVLGHLS